MVVMVVVVVDQHENEGDLAVVVVVRIERTAKTGSVSGGTTLVVALQFLLVLPPLPTRQIASSPAPRNLKKKNWMNTIYIYFPTPQTHLLGK
jgi:hypothetical protein